MELSSFKAKVRIHDKAVPLTCASENAGSQPDVPWRPHTAGTDRRRAVRFPLRKSVWGIRNVSKRLSTGRLNRPGRRTTRPIADGRLSKAWIAPLTWQTL
jgi:hypothetical protein